MFDRAIAYCKERTQFGKKLVEFQVTQHKLADIATMKYEPFHGKVLFKTPKYNDYFKENFKTFNALDTPLFF